MTRDELKDEAKAIGRLIGYEHASLADLRADYERRKITVAENVRLLHREREEIEKELKEQSEEEG